MANADASAENGATNKATDFDRTLDAALSAEPAPAHLRAAVMGRIAEEAELEAGIAALKGPRFGLPAAAFAVGCIVAGYMTGGAWFNTGDEFASELAASTGLADGGESLEDVL